RTPFPRWPVLHEEDVAAAAEVLRSGHLTSLTGGVVAEFEAEFARYHGVRHALATSSGTTAIHLALVAANVGSGDEVIVPAHTFIASATPVMHQGATPVFADVDTDTFTLLPSAIEAAVTPRTKAIIAVHLNGHPAPMDELTAVAKRHALALIEDAAQAHGALYQGRKVGTIGRMGCFSFWEDKIITSGGEGGAVITDDDALAQRLARLRSHGEGPLEGERRYYHLELGYNYRLAAVQAAVGLAQLRRLDEYLEARRRNASYLSERLRALPEVQPPLVAEGCVHSYYKYICKLRTDLITVSIDRFVAAVAGEGVPCSRRYPTPLPQQPVFKNAGHARGSYPNAEALAGQLFLLQVHPTIQQRDLEDVAAAIEKVAAAYRKA
ncbi:MAG: DegT/DnrJ/EryC1/StrS family aminotransferase, partial [Dehalococcoidia bacterium]